MDLLGVVIGTGILWGLKIFGTYPLAKHLNRNTLSLQAPPNSKMTCQNCGKGNDENSNFCIFCGHPLQMKPEEGKANPKDDVDTIPLGTYILADSTILGLGGLFISLITGWFFVGFSLKPRDIPGMVVFIIASLFGSGVIR